MPASQPLKGLELIDCAKASATQGLQTAAYQCGYGDNLDAFQQVLQQACQDIGVQISELSDLITDQQAVREYRGIEVAPDTTSEL